MLQGSAQRGLVQPTQSVTTPQESNHVIPVTWCMYTLSVILQDKGTLLIRNKPSSAANIPIIRQDSTLSSPLFKPKFLCIALVQGRFAKSYKSRTPGFRVLVQSAE